RVRWGDCPGHEVYTGRFPARAAEIGDCLRRMDIQLAAEHGDKRPKAMECEPPMALPVARQATDHGTNHIPVAQPVAVASGIDSVALLSELLQDFQILTSKQQNELGEQLTRFADPATLAGYLVERGWLTRHQVNQIFLGRGRNLLLGPYVLLEPIGEGLTG